ncbi:hypothetical protein OEZ85_004799 [Tetradesmus obliquus]|uniref:Uncharacterized protein n=1 Tax=Tetradesmus obliquus TaxID=3088 RepID=A0ABY8UFT7_TETOB|nr:hypothetical protein OEZ85_004799 [Tetradesmus obliquus]
MGGPRWQKLQQARDCPGPRSSHCMAYANGRIYMFGGELQPRVPVPAATYVYDLADSTWSQLKTAGACPGPRVAATMAAIGSKLYLFGGRTGIDMGEGATGAWQQLPGCEYVGARGGSVLVASGDGSQLLLMGGFNGDEMRDCHSYDIAAATWNCPACCDAVDTAAVNINGSCAAKKGEAGCASQHVSSLAMPLARSVFGAAVHTGCSSSSSSAAAASGCPHAGHIVAFGGEVSPSDKGHAGAGNFCAAAYCLSPPGHPCGEACTHATAAGSNIDAAGSHRHSGWHVLDAAGEGPGPRGWFAAAAVAGGDLVVHGGLGGDTSRMGDMFRLCMH